MFMRVLRLTLLIIVSGLAPLALAQDAPPKVPAEEKLPPEEKPIPPTPEAAPALPTAPGEHGCCAPPVEHTSSVRRIRIAEVQEMTTVPRLPVREEIVKVPFLATDVEYREEKQLVTVMVAKPRQEMREIRSVSTVQETTIDPCTGCPCTTSREVPNCRSVLVDVVDYVPETREVIVKVPVLKPVEKLAVVKRIVVDHIEVPARITHFQAVETAAEVTTPMPGCLPPITPAPPQPDCAHGHCH
jgi:hypothetical protein